MEIKNEIKSKIVAVGESVTSVVNAINKNRPPEERTSRQNLSNKLSKGTIKYSEVKEIAEVLGYEIVWRKVESR